MLNVAAILLEILKKTARCPLYHDPYLIEKTYRQYSSRLLRAEGLNKWDTSAAVRVAGVIRCVGNEVWCF